MSLEKKSASYIFHLLKKGEISAREILKDCRERFNERDHNLNAFVATSWKRAEKKAKKIDEKRKAGEELPPLSGLPIAIKDNMARRRDPMTCCSNFLADFYPGYSATVVEKLEKAGAVIIGRTNMDEMAMGSTTEKSAFFPTRNPHDLHRVPGGSSGGSAAAVGGGIVPLALGSETGGSIRQPASFCGVYGLRPTYGRVSRFGLVAYASSLDQIGPFAADLDDLWLIFSQLAGKDERDQTTVVGKDLKRMGENFDHPGLRVALPREYLEKVDDEEISKRLERICVTLEKTGVKIEEVSLIDPIRALAVYSVIATAEASSNLARFDGIRFGPEPEGVDNWEDFIKKSRAEGFGEEVKNRIALGALVLSSEYRKDYFDRALMVREEIRKELEELWQRFDLILSPATPTPAFELGSGMEISLQKYMSDILAIPASLAGMPAISLPAGLNEDGLPLGLQLMGPMWSEPLLIDFAEFIKQITGFGAEVKFRAEGGSGS